MRRDSIPALALCGYGVLNALLYVSLLPLWEGFDEPFHYATVQTLSRDGRFPVLKRSGVSDEIRASLPLAPASHVVKRNIPSVTTFTEFFRLDPAERRRRISALHAIPPALGNRIPDDGTNYEAQQAPLAYLVLAPFDRLWDGVPLPGRVWRLRIICAILAVLAATWTTLALARKLSLRPAFGRAAAFLVLSSQMFYGSAAHVSNDWLAGSLVPVLLLACVAYWQSPGPLRAAALGLALAAGLLTKAYFLAFVPLALVPVLLRRRGFLAFAGPVLLLAGPWYARNWLLYRNLTGLMDAITRPTLREIAGGAMAISWPRALLDSSRRALWTANNSFDTFSASTLNILLALAAAAALLYLWTARKALPPAGERILIAAWVTFSLVLAYSSSILYLRFGHDVFGGTPWYTPAIFPAAYLLLVCGLERGGSLGRAILAAMLAGWTYVIAATWWVKLIPLYGGFRERARPVALVLWYRSGLGMLDDTAMLTTPVLVSLAVAATAAAVILAGVLGAGLFRSDA